MPDTTVAAPNPNTDFPDYFHVNPNACPLYCRIDDAHHVARVIADIASEMLLDSGDGESMKIRSCAVTLARHLYALLEDGEACHAAMRKKGASHE